MKKYCFIYYVIIMILAIAIPILSGCSKSSGGNTTNQNQTNQPVPGDTSPVTTDVALVTDNSATIGGSFNNPAGYTTAIWFEYGTTTSYGNTISVNPSNAAAGNQTVQVALVNLSGQTTYHYRIGTSNSGGTFYGQDNSFATYITPITLVTGSVGLSHCEWACGDTTCTFWTWLCPGNSIAVDTTSVYWTSVYWTNSTPAVNKIGKNGGAIVTLATCSSPHSIKVDPANVYWADLEKVNKIGLNGGAITTIATGTYPRSIRIDTASLYWADDNNVSKVGINGGPVTNLVNGISKPAFIAIDPTSVYWSNGTLNKVGLNGGTATLLANGASADFEIDSADVYFYNANSINKVGLNGGTVSQIITTQGSPCSSPGIVDNTTLIKKANNIYFIDGAKINMINLSNNALTTLAATYTENICSIALDATHIYWITNSGTIKKLAI